jgi:hypothetical protein
MIRPAAQPLPWAARHMAPRVIALPPGPARETAAPPSPEESFRAAVERERIDRQRSAEAFRLAEEREKLERQRSEEQFRLAQQREARGGR